MIKEFRYKIIPHEQQRYETVGDYWETSPGVWEIRVSDVGDWRMALLVAIHEIVELGQTENDGVSEPTIKSFDESFEANHANSDEEPGDQPDAPYHEQHVFAETLERLLAQRLGINWNEYDKKLMAIWRQPGIKLNACRTCGASASVTKDKKMIVITCSQNRCSIATGNKLEEVSKIWNESQLKK